MSCESVIAPAGQAVIAGGGHSHGSFSPAEASLIHAGQTANQSNDGLIASLSGAKDSVVQTLEAKFQFERSIKENTLFTERSVNSARAELAQMVKDEGQRTRDLLRDQQIANLQVATTQAAMAALVTAAVKAAMPA